MLDKQHREQQRRHNPGTLVRQATQASIQPKDKSSHRSPVANNVQTASKMPSVGGSYSSVAKSSTVRLPPLRNGSLSGSPIDRENQYYWAGWRNCHFYLKVTSLLTLACLNKARLWARTLWQWQVNRFFSIFLSLQFDQLQLAFAK